MMIALDTNVIVAGLMTWHDDHRPAAEALRSALESASDVLVPVPALIEAWSVMTRLPSPFRVAPEVVGDMLDKTFRGKCRLVGLGEAEAWQLLARLEQGGWIGRLTHDAHILMCAAAGGADEIYTFNRRDFDRLTGFHVKVVNPRDRFPQDRP